MREAARWAARRTAPPRDAGEDAFLLHQLLRRREGVLRVDDDAAVEHDLVEDGRDEALVEAAQALHAVAGVRRRGDDLDAGLALLEVAAGAGEGAAGAEAGDEDVDLRQVAQDLGAGASRSGRAG